MADMCAAAVERGIPEIGFTEHYDQHPGDSCRNWLRVPEWAASLAQCRAEFAGRLIIRAGIEIGEPHIFTKEAQSVLAQHPFDYVLGSLHWVGADFDFDDGCMASVEGRHFAQALYAIGCLVCGIELVQ